MAKFVKSGERVELPYSRIDYLNYLDDDIESTVCWYGASCQLDNYDDLEGVFLKLKDTLENIIIKYPLKNNWFVSHDDKDLPWFPKALDDYLFSLIDLF